MAALANVGSFLASKGQDFITESRKQFVSKYFGRIPWS